MATSRNLAPTLALALAALLATPPAAAEEEADRALVDAAQNPAADLVNIRLRNELRLGMGPRERNGWATLFDPSFPTVVVDDAWNVVHRFRVAMVWQPEILARTGGYFAMSDLGYEAYLAPVRIGTFDWGLGATVLLPTGTDDHVAEHMWAAGPAVALRWGTGRLSLSLGARQLWTVATTGAYPHLNRLLLEPSITWALGAGFHLQSAPSIVFDQRTNDWLVPLGGGVTRLFSPAGQKLLVSLQAYRTGVSHSAPGAEWTVQLGTSLLFSR